MTTGAHTLRPPARMRAGTSSTSRVGTCAPPPVQAQKNPSPRRSVRAEPTRAPGRSHDGDGHATGVHTFEAGRARARRTTAGPGSPDRLAEPEDRRGRACSEIGRRTAPVGARGRSRRSGTWQPGLHSFDRASDRPSCDTRFLSVIAYCEWPAGDSPPRRLDRFLARYQARYSRSSSRSSSVRSANSAAPRRTVSAGSSTPGTR
jgi:hypothetical protein